METRAALFDKPQLTCRPKAEPIRLTSEEGLDLDSPDTPRRAIAENEAAYIDDALAICEDFELAVGLSNVVETDALADRCASAGLPGEGSASDRGAIDVVAGRIRRDVADSLVLVVVGRQVRVQLSGSVCAPHEAG